MNKDVPYWKIAILEQFLSVIGEYFIKNNFISFSSKENKFKYNSSFISFDFCILSVNSFLLFSSISITIFLFLSSCSTFNNLIQFCDFPNSEILNPNKYSFSNENKITLLSSKNLSLVSIMLILFLFSFNLYNLNNVLFSFKK